MLDLKTFLSELDALVESRDKVSAEALLQQCWDGKDPLSVAQAFYLQNFVIPSLYGVDCSKKKIPSQVHTELFSAPVEMSWEEWLTLFPNSVIECREDKPGGLTLSYELPPSEEWQREHGSGLFFSPNGFGPIPTAGHKTCRSIDNVTDLNAFFLDFDGDKKEETLPRLKSIVPRPSIIVESKAGYHAYWLIKGSIGLQTWKAIQNGLIDACGSDKACRDPSRLLRMPYSLHMKSVWTGGEPFRTSIVSIDKDWKVTEEDMAKYIKKEPKKEYTREYTKDKPVYMPQVAAVTEGQRHATLLEQAAKIYVGLDESKCQDARDCLKVWYASASKPLKDSWEAECDAVSDWLEKAQFGRTVSS